MSVSQFTLRAIPDDAEAFREEIREFLAKNLLPKSRASQAKTWMGFDAEFSRKLGAQGWIGVTFPGQYGGGGRSPFVRYVIAEELLAAGAPVSAHWIADRQSGPLILRFGDEAQKREHLPPICRGERFFCIGMSEPNAGSDLAAILTRAEKVRGGWRLSGRKVWTTNAHRSHFMIALVRTTKGTENRHGGLSQFIVDLAAPGIEVRPIRDLTGEEHFNEVVFDDVLLPDSALVGVEGQGWSQVMAELAFERSGPERFLSSMSALLAMLDGARTSGDAVEISEIGRLVARLVTLRQMSLAVTGRIANKEDAAWAAACVKEYGVTFEQDVLDAAAERFAFSPAPRSEDERAVAYLTQIAPSFSLRGGTREILRGIIARGLGLR